MIGRRFVGLQAALMLAALSPYVGSAEVSPTPAPVRRRCRPGCDFLGTTEEWKEHVRDVHSGPEEVPGDMPLLSGEELDRKLAACGFGGEYLPTFALPETRPLTEANLAAKIREVLGQDQIPEKIPAYASADPALVRAYYSPARPAPSEQATVCRRDRHRADPAKKAERKRRKQARRAGRR